MKLTHLNLNRSFAGLLGCLLLAGCTGSTYSGHFDCPMGEGAGCASISRVNKMIDRQEINLVEGLLPVEGRLPGSDDVPLINPSTNSAVAPQASSNQVYVYYGPDQLSRLIPTDDLNPPKTQKEN